MPVWGGSPASLGNNAKVPGTVTAEESAALSVKCEAVKFNCIQEKLQFG